MRVTTLLRYFEQEEIKILTLREPLEKWTDVHGANLLNLLYMKSHRHGRFHFKAMLC